jgi:L-iditol 2-dehydrogenase
MYAPAGVKTSTEFPIPDTMKAWVLGDPGEPTLKDKPVPVPKRAEVLVRIDAARSARPIWKSSIRARRP